MPSKHRPPSWYISGMRGHGKSELIAGLMAEWHSRRIASWLCDPMMEHPVPLGGRRYRPQLDQLDSAGMDADGPMHELGGEMARDAWLRPASERHRAVVLVYDDTNMVIRAGRQGPPHLNLVVHEGRHRNIGFCFSIRRPAETPRDYSSEAGHRAVFRCKEAIDVDVLRRMGVPDGTDRLGIGEFYHQGHGAYSEWHLHRGWMDPDGRLHACLAE